MRNDKDRILEDIIYSVNVKDKQYLQDNGWKFFKYKGYDDIGYTRVRLSECAFNAKKYSVESVIEELEDHFDCNICRE